jgi:hypothetical protein
VNLHQIDDKIFRATMPLASRFTTLFGLYHGII